MPRNQRTNENRGPRARANCACSIAAFVRRVVSTAGRDVALHETFALPRHGTANVARDRAIAAQDLRASIVDIERIDTESGHRKRAGLPTSGRTSNHDHPRPDHAASPRLERRIRVGQHIWRQLVGHELALGVDDS
jgi:hypothetical protein